jgi:hypothetical protein
MTASKGETHVRVALRARVSSRKEWPIILGPSALSIYQVQGSVPVVNQPEHEANRQEKCYDIL